MAHLTCGSRTVRRITGPAAVIGLLAACAVGTGDAAVPTPSRAGEAIARRVACTPQVLLLPTRTPTEESAATAINDDGWVAGWVAESGREAMAVLWRDNAPPLDLGVRGSPVDINEDGDILINRGSTAAFLWKDGTLRRLRGTHSRPRVDVQALNDHGVVVGSVSRIDWLSGRAAVWRNGQLSTLRHPLGPQPGWSFGADINNRGLILGWGGRGDGSRTEEHPYLWWWQGGRVGALSRGSSGRGVATDVDDRGRVVGFVAGRSEDDPWGGPLTWRSVRSDPKKFLNPRFGVMDLHADSGYVVGHSDGAFLAHLSDTRGTLLPDPPAIGEGFAVDFTDAHEVATGHNPYAPEGGVTVAGAAYYTSQHAGGGHRAVLWTCAQNYR